MSHAGRRATVAALLWIALVVGSVVWGRSLPGRELHLGSVAPLFGIRRVHLLSTPLIPAAVIAVVIAGVGPQLAATMRWRWLLLGGWLASAGWAVALAASDGWAHIAEPLTTRDEYLVAVPRIHGGVHSFLQHFVARLPGSPTHVKGHGPLALLVFYALAKVGLPQPTAAAVLVIGLGTSSVAAVAITVRALVDEDLARRALPFLVLIPAVVWIATTADAMFLGVSAWGVALLALAAGRAGRAGLFLGAASGLLFGATIYLSYGLLVFAPIPLAVIVLRRRGDLLLPVLAGVALVAAVFTIGGFDYLAGFRATHRAWAAGVGPHRSRGYFLVADLAELAICAGPGAAVGLGRLRDRRLTVLVGAVVVAVLASDATGFVRGEAERIWLPFAPWLLAAAGDLRLSRRSVGLVLLAQAATALAVQSYVLSPW